MNDQLRSVLSLSDGLPYFKDNFFERRFKKFAWRGGLILVILIGVYIPALVGNVLWIDETETNHELILRSANGLGQLWRHPSIQPTYQPMAETILWVQYYLWGTSSYGYLGFHAVSIALHIANCMLVWFILRRLNAPGAWLAAAIFALHPLQVQAVAWVGGQPMLVGTFFYAISLLLFCRFAQIEPTQDLDPSVKLSDEWYESHPDAPETQLALGSMPRMCYAFSLVFFLLAVLSDPAAWSIPVVLLLVLWWRFGSFSRKDLKALLPYLIVSAIAFIFGQWQSELYCVRQGVATNLWIIDRPLLPGPILAYYLWKLILPYPLSFSGPQWTASAAVWWQYIFLIALIAGLTWIWSERKRIAKGPMLAIAFFLLNIFPAIGLIRFGWMRYSYVGNYLQYRASIGLIALGVAGLMAWAARAKSKDYEHIYRIACGAVILAVLPALALVESLGYWSPTSLWSNDVAIDPHSEIAHRRLAWAIVHDESISKYRKEDRAIDQIRSALVDKPNNVSLILDSGDIYAALGNARDAESEFDRARKLDPQNTEVMMRQAAAKAHSGKVAEAIDIYLQVIQLSPSDAKPHAAVAALYASQKQLKEAISHLRTAVELEPRTTNSVTYWLDLARLLFADGQSLLAQKQPQAASEQFKASAVALQAAAKIDPNNYDTFMTAGELLSRLKDFGRAERMYRDACRVRPKSAEAWNNLGVAIAAQGKERFQEAIYAFNQALKQDPNFIPAQRNLAAAQQGEKQDFQASHAETDHKPAGG